MGTSVSELKTGTSCQSMLRFKMGCFTRYHGFQKEIGKALLALTLSEEKMISVLRVFEHGEKKHGDNVQAYPVQIRHANKHRVESNAGTTPEHESGLPHEAHTIARLILAICEVIREWEGDK